MLFFNIDKKILTSFCKYNNWYYQLEKLLSSEHSSWMPASHTDRVLLFHNSIKKGV